MPIFEVQSLVSTQYSKPIQNYVNHQIWTKSQWQWPNDQHPGTGHQIVTIISYEQSPYWLGVDIDLDSNFKVHHKMDNKTVCGFPRDMISILRKRAEQGILNSVHGTFSSCGWMLQSQSQPAVMKLRTEWETGNSVARSIWNYRPTERDIANKRWMTSFMVAAL